MGSFVSVLGWPIQLLMTLALEAYLIIIALYSMFVLLLSDKSEQKNINTLDYLFEVIFRWTWVLQVPIFINFIADLVPVLMAFIGYTYYFSVSGDWSYNTMGLLILGGYWIPIIVNLSFTALMYPFLLY